ncbi:hypothetical protein DLM45_09240 [Hyphomicrobium methylovorum]|uniref:hypothetical protein n=1 Tax=Hyphomicrobium methylovorum TaxID=84 RepID=UPI0015E725AB|nr:hypothetical protein [Hyphomicrobium methylovorum]MBA2126407.1 hypothetical protein [Hyphomicrobium methylovorum]
MANSQPATRRETSRPSAEVVPLPAKAPERLVGIGFRCWLAGLSTGDIKCWEDAWNSFSGILGPDQAKALLLDLSKFVRAVKANAQRDIEISPSGCRSFCRDECLAISIIAACQHDERQALTASAAALIGSEDIGDTLNGAQALAATLRQANQMLCAESVCPATCGLRAKRRRLM